MIDANLRNVALTAWRCSRDGVRPREIGGLLGSSTAEARTMVETGAMIAEIDQALLKAREEQLIMALGQTQLQRMHDGNLASPVGWEVSSRVGRSAGWAASASRRLRPEHGGLGLVRHSSNGHMWLTATGWALFAVLARAGESPTSEDRASPER